MDDFATKPLVLDDLAEALGRWLPAAGTPRTHSPAGTPRPPLLEEDEDAHRIRGQLTRLSDDLGSLEAARRVVQAWLEELPAGCRRHARRRRTPTAIACARSRTR